MSRNTEHILLFCLLKMNSAMRQNGTRHDEEGARTTKKQPSIRFRSIDVGTDRSSTTTAVPADSPNYVHYIQGFTDLASAFNWGVIVLTLGSYGLLLSTPLFWLCWSILVTEAVSFYSIRPYWTWLEKKRTDQGEESKNPHRPSDLGRAGAVFLKVGMSIALIVMLIYSHDLGQRQNKILLFAGVCIILCEGFPPIFMVRDELKTLERNPSVNGMQIIQNITEDHNWDHVDFLSPSVINAMIVVTGGIVLGGNLGSLMPEKPYWIFVSIFLTDLMAEAIHRFDCGNRSLFDEIPEKMPKRHYTAIVLRLVVEGFFCYWMTKEISENLYFPSNVDANACDRQCQGRSKSLLITMVILGGLQAAGTFMTPLCSCVLDPHYAPCIILIVFLGICYLVFLFICKFLRGLIKRIICM